MRGSAARFKRTVVGRSGAVRARKRGSYAVVPAEALRCHMLPPVVERRRGVAGAMAGCRRLPRMPSHLLVQGTCKKAGSHEEFVR